MNNPDKESKIKKFKALGIESKDIFREIMRARKLDYILFQDPVNRQFGITADILYNGMKKLTSAELGVFPGNAEQFERVYMLALSSDPLDFIDVKTEPFSQDMTALLGKMIGKAEKSGKTVLFAGADCYVHAIPRIFQALPNDRVAMMVSEPVWKQKLSFLYPRGRFMTEEEMLRDKTNYDYIFYFAGESVSLGTLARKCRMMELWRRMSERMTAQGCMDAVLPQVLMNYPGKKIDTIRRAVAEKYVLSSYYRMVLEDGENYVLLTTETSEPEGQVIFGDISFEDGRMMQEKKEKTPRKNIAVTGTWDYDFWVYTESDFLKSLFLSGKLDMSFCIGEVFELCRTGKYISPRHCRTVSIGDLDGAGIRQNSGETGHDASGDVIIHGGDFLMTIRGSAFKTAVVPSELDGVSASSNLLVLRPIGRYTSEYLKMYLDSPVGREFIKAISTGHTRLNIRPDRVLKIPLLKAEAETIQNITVMCMDSVHTLEQAERTWRETQQKAVSLMIGGRNLTEEELCR